MSVKYQAEAGKGITQHPKTAEQFAAAALMIGRGYKKVIAIPPITDESFLRQVYAQHEGNLHSGIEDNKAPGGILLSACRREGCVTFWEEDADTKYFLEEVVPKICKPVPPVARGIQVRVTLVGINKNDELTTDHVYFDSDDHDINPDLYPNILIPELFDYYAESNESVMVIGGVPGTGKTTLLKYFMCRTQEAVLAEQMKDRGEDDDSWLEDAEVVYVKDPKVVQCNNFWMWLTNEEPDLIILDDLDFALSTRTKKKKNTFMNQLLSFSDGIFSVDSKILITTNIELTSVDSALLRSGRCCDVLTIEPMPAAYAVKQWKKVVKGVKCPYTAKSGPILQSDFMSAINRAKLEKPLDRPYWRSGAKSYSVIDRVKPI